ncbi:Os09g0355700 [Oryza sativa Japonica Group]|uniref:Os09g0355700 protein n=1 Tax=Oryza sativa subsp. japonica TaxID=39947 RepID=A0A0P0XMF0_ORYSJ|nr:Os09g0355700 [Oryza sativa Japonica Group]
MNYYSNDYIYVPEDVLRTAVTTSATSVPLNITQSPNWPTDWTYFHFLHFANFEQQLRQLDIYYGKNKWEYSPLSLSSMQPTYSPIVASLCNISIVATNTSVLPPMLNAIEIYFGIPRNDSATSPDDGLDYLHTGCVLPIIHRDLKSHNILLGHDMVAKISDFGLSKSYFDVAQSHISVSAAGTIGYIDPEYCLSCRLTTSSDVFSFVVLLEIVTGEPPIVPTTRVKEKVTTGNIEAIVDPRLDGDYDVSSIWKVVDIALLCTKEASDERPTMSMVVAQLKDALALEEARNVSISDISQKGANLGLSFNSMPSAR